jgi:hypothetical protein
VDQLCRDPKVTKELLAQLTATAKEGKLKVGVVGWGLVNGRMGGRLGGCRAARLPGGMAHLPTLCISFLLLCVRAYFCWVVLMCV